MSTDLVTLSGAAMGSRWTVRMTDTLATADLSRHLAKQIEAFEQQASTWRPDSDLMRLNRADLGCWVDLPADLLAVLIAAQEVGHHSEGMFDIAVGDLVQAWGFGPAQGQTNTPAIQRHLGQSSPGIAALEIDQPQSRARRMADVSFDLSGIAKGYGVDLLAETLVAAGISSALVGLDGEMRAVGPRPDGKPWHLALETPIAGVRSARGMIELEDCSIATSGDYRHVLQIGVGQVSHSMNPRRGAPVQNRLASVSVMATACWQADAWATVLMVLGEVAGPAYAAARNMDAIFLIRDPKGGLQSIASGRLAAD